MAFFVEKKGELSRRRQRRGKLSRLREKFSSAKTEDEKSAILAKAGRVAPWLSQEEFLSPLNPK